MHAGVGAPGADHVHIVLRDRTDGGFDRRLNGRQVRLDLPTVVVGPVVLQRNLKCRHGANDTRPSALFSVGVSLRRTEQRTPRSPPSLRPNIWPRLARLVNEDLREAPRQAFTYRREATCTELR